jgi:hypothetical protein
MVYIIIITKVAASGEQAFLRDPFPCSPETAHDNKIIDEPEFIKNVRLLHVPFCVNNSGYNSMCHVD